MSCQINALILRQPPTELSSILSPIPFAVWGINLIGSIPIVKCHLKFCVIVIDYMTKQVEASPLRKITEEDMKKSFQESVVLRFGNPRVLISDNGTQFIGRKFEGFLDNLGIQHRKRSVGHSQANRQVEVTNRSLLFGIKKRLDNAKGK